MKPFGSGYFGEWITDAQGLPAYRYTCDQNSDPIAATPTNPTWRGEREHTFQFGNDRVIAVCGNNGAVQVRQDEGAPKLLGDYNPAANSYGGGIGWLTDGKETLCTHYDTARDAFERVYGIGYMSKTVSKGHLKAEQTIFAPYGDDPVLISRVTVTNTSSEQADLRWFEYWSARHCPLSFLALLYGLISMETVKSIAGGKGLSLANNSTQEMRRDLAERFTRQFLQEGNILGESKSFTGWTKKEKRKWNFIKKVLAPLGKSTNNNSYFPGELDDQEDLQPPSTFLFAADVPLDGFITDATRFFGSGGLAKPEGLANPQFGAMKSGDSAMIAVSSLNLAPGESRTLTYVYGYVPEGFSREALVEKYSGGFDALFAASCEAWKSKRVSLELPDEDGWVDRELLWHHHALRSAMSYDSAFWEHILSQGHLYQYIMGFQGAARDPLQHVMPFIFTDPGVVREIVRYTCKEILPDGAIPYGIGGPGQIMVSPIQSSDFELWLIWTASEYVLAQKDASLLDEVVEPYPFKGQRQEKATILELLLRCYAHFIDNTGQGEHGLPHLLGGDWNDNIVVGSTPSKQQKAIRLEGESVLVGAMAAVVLGRFADMLEFAGKDSTAQRERAEKLRAAVRDCWNGKWMRRAFLSKELGWIGDDLLWLEPQPWALMAEATGDPAEMLRNIKEMVRDPSPIGAMLSSECLPQMSSPPGTATNAGIWASINGTLILALARNDMAAAWEEWRKNTLANHAEQYPEAWVGIWSGPDCYNSIFAEKPSQTHYEPDPEKRAQSLNWTDYPVYNLHPHAWTLYNAACLIANEFTTEGLNFSLELPKEAYAFASPLVGLKRDEQGFSGWYAPAAEGEWKVTLSGAAEGMELTVNGSPAQYSLENGKLAFTGKGSAEAPLRFTLKAHP